MYVKTDYANDQRADRSRFESVILVGWPRRWNDTISRQTNRVIMCILVRVVICKTDNLFRALIDPRYDGLFSSEMRYQAVQHLSKGLCQIRRCKVRLPRYLENGVQKLNLGITSFWKPIKGPVYDFPLTLCDRRTVDYASHTTAMDIVTFNSINENTRVYFDEKHEWYYWHGLQVDEVIAFIQADSDAENCAGMTLLFKYSPIFVC
jgi:hypothetical protein